MARDYYTVLGVTKKAEPKDIKSAYRKLTRKYHPDVNPNDKQAAQKFAEVSEAYDVLGDPEKRKLYDQFGANWDKVGNFAGGASNGGGGGRIPDMEDIDFDFGGQGFESIFGNIFGGFAGNRGGGSRVRFEDLETAQPRDVEKVIEIGLEEIDSGTKRTLTYQTMDANSVQGAVATVPTTKKVEITIPAGIDDGKKLRVPGKGAAGVQGRAGDLYVTVKWARHPLFTPVGDHLEVDVPVPYTVAALGGEISVPTLRKTVTMKIPAGTQTGQKLRLAGQGISRMNGGRTDLMARVKITVPKHLSPEEKQLLEQIAKLETNKQ